MRELARIFRVSSTLAWKNTPKAIHGIQLVQIVTMGSPLCSNRLHD